MPSGKFQQKIPTEEKKQFPEKYRLPWFLSSLFFPFYALASRVISHLVRFSNWLDSHFIEWVGEPDYISSNPSLKENIHKKEFWERKQKCSVFWLQLRISLQLFSLSFQSWPEGPLSSEFIFTFSLNRWLLFGEQWGMRTRMKSKNWTCWWTGQGWSGEECPVSPSRSSFSSQTALTLMTSETLKKFLGPSPGLLTSW